jgi:hypothetical protein
MGGRAKVRRILLCLAAWILPALPAAAQSHGPDGFRYPMPDRGMGLMFGGTQDELYWSWFEIGPDVCAGENARIYLRVGGRRATLPCEGFVHARVAPGRHPKNWGRTADPIRAESVSAVLSEEPPAMLTLDSVVPRTDRRQREIQRIMMGDCEILPDGIRVCQSPEWPESRRLVAIETGPRLRDGLPFHMICDAAEDGEYCRIEDSARGPGRVVINVAFPAIDAAALAAALTFYAEGTDRTADWLR